MIITKRMSLSALCLPDFVIPRGHSTLYRCSLTIMAQDIPFHEIPLTGTAATTRGAVP